MSETYYWHDYETTGTDPARDRPMQFAGVRTDAQLNIIGEPLVIYAKPATDVLPQPQACLVTGISPQLALQQGYPECEFIAQIHREFSQPGTCVVGYNSLRFDDEFTRNTLYRNFYDPYAREWQNGNSRWDIIDMLRATYALRPEGIIWPRREDGHASFRLEELTQANGIAHAAAHDALSDVEATIAMARLVREKQPRLYEYVRANRGKKEVMAQLDIAAMKPVLHVSGMFGAQRKSTALVVPLALHPSNRNEVICYDLSVDPTILEDLSAQEIQQRLYRRSDELAEGEQRPGFKSIHINRCPIVVTAKMADSATAVRLSLDGDVCRKHLKQLRAFRERDPAAFSDKLQAIYQPREYEPVTDPDRMLYGGGFFSEADKRTMTRILAATPVQLSEQTFSFEDARLPEMLFRYRARNYPETLSESERAQWEEFRFLRLTEADGGGSICLEDYQEQIEQLMADQSLSHDKRELLQQLMDYGDSLLA